MTATASGAVLLTMAMLLATVCGLRWNLWILILPFGLLWFGVRPWGSREHPPPYAVDRIQGRALAALVVAVIGMMLVTYTAATARSTSTDLVLFWGPKGQQFARAGGIDAGFLSASANYFMHPDYPPLLPCLYAWATLSSGRFAWGATLLIEPLFVALSALAFWGFAKSRLGTQAGLEAAALLVVLLGYCLSVTMSTGAAEPVLLFFETLAFSALVFGERVRETLCTAALALVGCALTKVEGLVVAVVAAAVFGPGWRVSEPLRRRFGRTTTLLMPPLAASLFWVLFSAQAGLLDSYRGGGPLHLEYLPIVLRELPRSGRYESGYLPWIVVGLLLAVNAMERRGWRSLVVGMALFAFAGFAYLHMSTEPTQWIGWSGGRVLLSALIALFFAATSPTEAARTSELGGALPPLEPDQQRVS